MTGEPPFGNLAPALATPSLRGPRVVGAIYNQFASKDEPIRACIELGQPATRPTIRATP